MLIVFTASPFHGVLLLTPSSLSTPDEALFGDALALIPVFLNREKSHKAAGCPYRFFPSVTSLALDQVQWVNRSPCLGQFPKLPKTIKEKG